MCMYVFGGLRPKLQDFTFYLACYYYSDDHAILICEYNYSTILRSNNFNNIFISSYRRIQEMTINKTSIIEKAKVL